MHRRPLPIALSLILLGLSGIVESAAAQTMRVEGTVPQVGVTGEPQFSIRSWSIGDGLPQSSITQLEVDEAGFVWGTTYGGIFRFDGRSFVTHVPAREDGASGLAVTGMIPASKGGFWIANTRGAVSRIDERGQVVEEIPIPTDLPQSEFPVSLHEDTQDHLWLLGWGEVRIWDGQAWRLHSTEVERSWPPTKLIDDGAGNLIVPVVDGFVNLGANEALPSPWNQIEVTSWSAGTSMDSKGRIWIGARDFFYVYSESQLIPISGIRGFLLDVHPRRDGSIWIVTFAGTWLASGPGLDRPGQLQAETTEVSQVALPDGLEILSTTVTHDDVLVLGLLGRGLITVTPSPSLLIDTRPYLLRPDTLSRTIHSLVSDGHGGLWISRDCGDFARIEGSVLQSIRSPVTTLQRTFASPDICVRSLHLTQSGRLLAGIPNGILRVDQGADRGTQITIPESNARPRIPMTLAAPVSYLDLGQDSILMGMNDGRLMLLTPRDDVIPWPDWTPMDGSILALARSPDGTLWIGAEGRLWSIDSGGRIQPDRPLQGSHPLEPIRILLPDENGGLWIGRYGGGLSYRAPNGVRTPIPLADQTLSSVLFSNDGSLWIAQNSGLSVLRADVVEAIRRNLPLTPIIQRLSYPVGIPEVNDGRPAGALLPSGMLAIGTVGGLLLVDPYLMQPSGLSPTLRLESIRTASGVRPRGNGILELPINDRTLEVEFSVPSFRSFDGVQLRYRISSGRIRPQPGAWIPLPYGEPLRLAGLAPGRRRLEVEAIVPGGTWVAAPPVDFRVPPRMSERRTVQLGLVVLILGLVLLLIRGKIREQERDRSLSMERRLEAERERHLGELALMGRHAVAGELTASLAHEMGQPLAAMLQTASAVKTEMESAPLSPDAMNETMEELIGQIHRARNVLRGMRRFLRSNTPRVEHLDLREVAEEVRDLMRRELHQAKVSLEIEGSDEAVGVAGERVLIQQSLIILVSNAMDAVSELPVARRIIRLRLKSVRGGGRITVQDVGGGMTAARLKTIFEPFESTKTKGMGMGLPIARRIVRSHRGVIRIRSQEGSGTVVSIWLPSTQPEGDHPPVS